MFRLKSIIAPLLIGALAVGLVAGCSQMPTAPAPVQSPATQVTASPGGNAAEPSSLLGGVVSVVDGLLKLVFRLLSIDGSIGGSLTNGRWTVDVPPGAIDGTASVGIGVTDAGSSSCELQILPITKNRFSVPVRLSVSCPNVSSAELQNYVILLYNPQTRTWAPVAGSKVDLASKTVSAPLQHFSTYKVGRAGW